MALSLSKKFMFYNGNARRIVINLQQSHRNKSSTPLNMGVMFVPQQVRPPSVKIRIYAIKKIFLKLKIYVLATGSLGRWKDGQILADYESRIKLSNSRKYDITVKFTFISNYGFFYNLKVIDQVKYVQSLKEIAIGKQSPTTLTVNWIAIFQMFPSNRQSHPTM